MSVVVRKGGDTVLRHLVLEVVSWSRSDSPVNRYVAG